MSGTGTRANVITKITPLRMLPINVHPTDPYARATVAAGDRADRRVGVPLAKIQMCHMVETGVSCAALAHRRERGRDTQVASSGFQPAQPADDAERQIPY